MNHHALHPFHQKDGQRHICSFYGSKSDLLEMNVNFFHGGLAKGDLCIWILNGALGLETARMGLAKRVDHLDKYLVSGQMNFIRMQEWYYEEGKFSAERSKQNFFKWEQAATEKGYQGLRVSGDASEVRAEDWEDCCEYERDIEEFFAGRNISALCTYPLAVCDLSRMARLSMNHGFSFINDGGRFQLLKSSGLPTEW